MFFDRFDIMAAYYYYLSQYHEGQWSESYKRLYKIMKVFKPSPFGKLETETENCKNIYNQLVEKGYVNRQLNEEYQIS